MLTIDSGAHREQHLEAGVARLAVHLHRSTVTGDDRGDDREAETGATGGTGSGAVAAREALEQHGLKMRRDAGAVIRHGHDRIRTVDRDGGHNVGTGGGVHPGVGEQVGEHLMQASIVAIDHHWFVGHVEGPFVLGTSGVGIAHGIDEQAGEVEWRACEVAPLVEAGEEKQVFDEGSHAYRFRLDPAERVNDVCGQVVITPSRELGVSANRR